MKCDCIHEESAHDPDHGACLAVNPIFGACPCAATSTQVRETLNYVARVFLRPEYRRVKAEAITARANARNDYLKMIHALVYSSDPEQEALREQIRTEVLTGVGPVGAWTFNA